MRMTAFQSTHPIGTVLALQKKRQPFTATLHRRFPNGEEWRISDARGRYVYSDGWPFVREHQAAPAIADFAATLNPPAGALADTLPFALEAEWDRPAPAQQPDLFTTKDPEP